MDKTSNTVPKPSEIPSGIVTEVLTGSHHAGKSLDVTKPSVRVTVYPKFRTLEVLEKMSKQAYDAGWVITRFSAANMYFVATKYTVVEHVLKDPSTCKHPTTSGRSGEKGSWCIDCGKKILEVHDKPCKGCKHYFQQGLLGLGGYSGCRYHLMGVTPSMLVTYRIGQDAKSGGLCYEPKES